jgi:hypothetical protein
MEMLVHADHNEPAMKLQKQLIGMSDSRNRALFGEGFALKAFFISPPSGLLRVGRQSLQG